VFGGDDSLAEQSLVCHWKEPGSRATMKTPLPSILTLNGGSSSIRFALHSMGDTLTRGLSGKLDRIGMPGTTFTVRDPAGSRDEGHPGEGPKTVDELLHWLEDMPGFAQIQAVGHRVVHGMEHTEPAWVTDGLVADLKRIQPCDPEHLPQEIALIEAFQKRHPEIRQAVCFDTSFHRTLPRVARLLAIPRRFDAKGVRRYGFHGLSYAFLMEELRRLGDPAATEGRVILAHLGNGASLAAVRDGRSVETSMGFTPAAGLVMGRRSGDLDPGLGPYLARTEGLSMVEFDRMANAESGLLGISETSSDMRELLASEVSDVRAAEAVACFCHQAKKCLGAYVAVLGGLDTLVFAGGIGENCPTVRARICEGLEFLGIGLDGTANLANQPVISKPDARVTVRVIRTDEELMIARQVVQLMGVGG
jgi:acetate kinase